MSGGELVGLEGGEEELWRMLQRFFMAAFAFDMIRNIFSADILIYIYMYFYLYALDMEWRGTAAATATTLAASKAATKAAAAYVASEAAAVLVVVRLDAMPKCCCP